MTTPFYFLCLLWGPFGSSRSLGKIPTFGPATPTGRPNPAKPVLLLGNEPKLFYKFLFVHFYDLHSAAFFARFSKILASIEDFLKKQASQLLSCRGGLGEAPYNTLWHLLQRCNLQALWEDDKALCYFTVTHLKKTIKFFKRGT